jgi:hypothetical protein
MKIKDKIVTELTPEELMELAAGHEVKMDSLTDAGKFIYDLGIKHGREKIRAQLLYWHYKHYKGWNNKKQPKADFFRDFRKYHDSHRDNQGIYFLLDPKPFDLSDEAYWQMRAEERSAKNVRKTKKTT